MRVLNVLSAEWTFKHACRVLIQRRVHPTPGKIQVELGRRVSHNINGRECRWLREDLRVPRINRVKYERELKPCPWNCCAGTGLVP